MLRISGLSKAYGSIRALDRIDFELRRGEVMALVGENGAGKSTLVKILAGLVRPDAGEILLEGSPVGHGQALRHAGIAVVQQELSLVPTMSAAENVFLGHPEARLVQTPGRLAERARPFLAQVGLGHIEPLVAAGDLVVAEQQLVEVARLVARDARILILDEPTAALSDAEIGRVKEVVRRLVAEGRSVIYITHRLGEVFELADRVTVFRNGSSQPPVPVRDITPSELVERMLGRALENAGELAAERLKTALEGRFRHINEISVTIAGLGGIPEARRLLETLRSGSLVTGAAFEAAVGKDVRLRVFVEKLSADDLAAGLLRFKEYRFAVRAVEPFYQSIELEAGGGI